ncbi:cob(I)yrinic acid a,c-diamide adenosyltransferase [Fusobacterium sp.]|jgi:cob(I)alamin adenosyltransferase|uniref:cob(I)yrinic acid a,c-diamide adenosyltransferase n=1 Tax=Fusobacterium sp. TaxID=68766 RepID=UPI001D44AAEB|nr:cob(I)yrinic acid a,c-diamide adenosyltransferase [Fusobacterium sp.]MBS5788953.1 cob(I)yrinic acid a,c-diamide adenosyltransferase [Fusobacterium sp.]
MMKGYVQVYTGNGKGKTTAALGLAVRALGNGFSVYIGQFMKGQEYHELKTFEKLDNIDVEMYGTDTCLISREHVQQCDIDHAKAGVKRVKEIFKSKKYQIVILDEICVANFFGLVSEEEILDLMENKPEDVELVLTGRYAPQSVIDRADLVTEMKEIKHYYSKGVMSRDGIER